MTEIDSLSERLDRLRDAVESSHRGILDRIDQRVGEVARGLGGAVERTTRIEVQLAQAMADQAEARERERKLEERVRYLEAWRWYMLGALALAGVVGSVVLALARR